MGAIDSLRGAAGVTRNGRVLFETAGGPADAAAGTVCTPHTRFQIASVSKQFAACAALLLAEDGTLELADPVERWLDGVPSSWREVTLHHLLTHTAGIGHWEHVLDCGIHDVPEPGEFREAVARAPLRTPPGSTWHYSSPAYVLAAQMIEQAAGMPYARLVSERIFQPLGMTATHTGPLPAKDAARGHRDGERVRTVDDLSTMPGTGDVWSTTGDMARYAAALGSGELLSTASVRVMRTAHAPLPEEVGKDGTVRAEAYGYGIMLGTVAGRRARFHPGDNPGYVSFHAWLPDEGVSVTVLSNDESTDVGAVTAELLATTPPG